MAEIKSTLEKVMERVAAMGPISRGEIDEESIIKEGMRLAADYMRGNAQELSVVVAGHPEEARRFFLSGVLQALLRNIVLPKDDEQQDAARAMQGLLELGKGARKLIEILGETKELLERYREHRQQLRQQLEAAIRQQLQMALAQKGIKQDLPANIDPRMHPKYQEEWQRIRNELSQQYGQALDQSKELITEMLGG
jgi:Rad3-related DNA helicase